MLTCLVKLASWDSWKTAAKVSGFERSKSGSMKILETEEADLRKKHGVK